MAPPYNNSWTYFRVDALEYINANRNWTAAERNYTLSTIWAGDANVRNHYDTLTWAGGRRTVTSPGLPNPNPIPAIPYTAADVTNAKVTGAMPLHALALAPPPPPPPASASESESESESVNSQPGDFWPKLPWSPEPVLPPYDIDMVKVNGASREAWLSTEPYMPSLSDGSHWHGVRTLGVGGYGAAGLWIQTDAAGNVRDRMVIKEAKTFSPTQWSNPRNWRDRLPREVRIHQLVEERRSVEPDSCRHLIRFRGHRIWMQLRRYRIYLDFYPEGDLNSAMKRYAGNWAGDEDDYEPNEEDYISEGFIWGTLSDNAVNAWKPITHLDLQPANVLLDTTAPMNNAAYGGYFGASAHGAHTNDSNEPPYVPILADFGISFFTPGDLGSAPSDNPEKFLTAFDTRYPPEMNQLPPRNVKFGEKTDVWGIGNIAYKLIMNGLVDQGPIRCDTSTKDDLFEEFDGKMPLAADYWRNAYPNDDGNVFRPGCKACRPAEEYQPDLKQLVRRCLNYEQDERPSLMEIIAEVDQHFSEFPEHMDELMDKGRYNFRVPDLDQLSTGEAMDVDT